MRFADLLKESLRSGIIASLVMMPVGFLFRFAGVRVGHYGPKFSEALFGSSSPGLLLAQHFILGWLSAIPLLLLLIFCKERAMPILIGFLYGVVYYVVVNSLALPLAFGDPTPWQLGFDFIYPSLVVHIIYGASIGFTARGFLRKSYRVVSN